MELFSHLETAEKNSAPLGLANISMCTDFIHEIMSLWKRQGMKTVKKVPKDITLSVKQQTDG